MKILALHSDYINFESKKKAIKSAEDIDPEKMKESVKDCLVVFTSVEKVDEEDPKAAAAELVSQVKDIAKQVKSEEIVLYPYAHLSSSLSKPEAAVSVLKEAELILASESFNVTRAPFGWYKAFEVSCKGHPLSELSREFTAGANFAEGSAEPAAEEGDKSEAEKKEEKTRKVHYVLDTDGKLTEAEKFDFKRHPALKKLYAYETAGTRTAKKEPPHIELMRRLELVDYEPGSDSGNFRWYPKGTLIKKLLEEHVTSILIDNGAMQVETPIMYSTEHPQLKAYLGRFPARQYNVISDDKKLFLRFAACFGQYLMKRDMQISHKHLPLKLYELTHYSFRREQRGELAGIKRLRAFTMPDMHTLCKDIKQAQEEFVKQYKLSMGFMKDIEMEFDTVCRFERKFYEDNEKFAKELVKLTGKPMLLELFDERYAYFVMKFEFSVNDALDKAATLSTVQIDVENTERFGITFTDSDGKKKHPLMLHASISGSIDRDLYAMLETQYLKTQKGEAAMFPLWLAPTQVRVIPVSAEKHLKFSEDLMKELESNGIRADLDDIEDSVGKKIRNATREWVPYIVVVGDNELTGDGLMVRIRGEKDQKKMTKEEIISVVKDKTKGFPFKKLPLPKYLTKRPSFTGMQ